jgi:hypothetical protein
MVTVVKSEWHQIEKRYSVDIDEDVLAKIYPEMDEDEITALMKQIIDGEKEVSEVMDDAFGEVDIDWDWMDEDDMWTDRKGGYEVTYEILE